MTPDNAARLARAKEALSYSSAIPATRTAMARINARSKVCNELVPGTQNHVSHAGATAALACCHAILQDAILRAKEAQRT